MLFNVLDDANIKLGDINEILLGRNITYAQINGFYKLTDIYYVLIDMNVQPKVL